MKRSASVLASLIVAVLTVASITPVLAANVVPSYEILSVEAANTCNNGIVWVNAYVNHNGSGSLQGWIGRDGVGGEGSYGMADFSLIPAGNDVAQINVPGSFPENTVFYIALTTYSEANAQGNATFLSKVYFNCTTGEQVGGIFNVALPLEADIDVPVAGPAYVHPLDEVAINPGAEVMTQPQQDRLGNFEIQDLMSTYNQAETLNQQTVQTTRVTRGG